MIDKDFNIKIIDFGTSKILSTNSKRLSRTKRVKGTEKYLSPEMFYKLMNMDDDLEINLQKVIYSQGFNNFKISRIQN